jgi:Ni/Co efflux regulator RcnB
MNNLRLFSGDIMKKITMQKKSILVGVIALTLSITSPVLADKPSWAGGKDKGEKHGQKEQNKQYQDNHRSSEKNQYRSDVNVNVFFGDQHRQVINRYYTEQYQSGHCPPGLAKKNNGCKPPGQAKKWQVGHRIPRDVIFHDLPPSIVIQLGTPPSGHRFVRVASDILMIAVGTGLIVDAIQDLNSL